MCIPRSIGLYLQCGQPQHGSPDDLGPGRRQGVAVLHLHLVLVVLEAGDGGGGRGGGGGLVGPALSPRQKALLLTRQPGQGCLVLVSSV